jgi:flavodoxin
MHDSPQIIQLLTEIKSILQMSGGSKYMIAIIAASSGILGASIPAIFQYFNTKNTQQSERDKIKIQIRTEIVTKQRQEWVDSIRMSAKDLLAEFNLIFNHMKGLTEKKNLEEQSKIFFGMQQKMFLIELYLNPDNPKHESATKALHQLYEALVEFNKDHSDANEETYNQSLDDFKVKLVAVFREAWGKIKDLQ